MKKKPLVVITHWVHPQVLSYLERHCRVLPNESRESLPREELFSRLTHADAVMMFMPDWVDQELLDHAPKLKVIGAALKGFDNFDVKSITARGIWLTNVPDLLTVPTAELAIGLMLALSRNVLAGDRRVRSGNFQGWRPSLYGTGIQGRTVGIIGLGKLGQAVAQRLIGWEARVLGYDPVPLPDDKARELRLEQLELDELLGLADHVLLLSPLTESSHHLLNAKRLATMKSGSFLINAGRGSCVDEAAVAKALENGRLNGYSADVFEFEDWILPGRPATLSGELLSKLDQTLFTPHLGSAVEEVRLAIAMEAAENIVDALQQQQPRCAVNSPGTI
ncbi:MAG: hydroxyacid dehydrogenase [Desulfovibrio sp.]|nr:hydroxyacid dehydrogenase [Desulfovibrio sp.]MBI4959683.1 hydroxyacid dehydrogenase [Desulfovibrio sp.]